jgi:tRNA (guanine-N7-)-methyltransferase
VNNFSTNRPVRSFVRRQGRITSSQKSALEELLPKYGIQYSLNLGLLPSSLMGNPDFPLILDIGFGDGELLISIAKEKFDTNFIGVEVYDAGIGHCLKLIEQNKLDNLKVVSGDAVEVMKFGIEDGSLSEINLLFPDPWPKKRHHKRRIINAEFIELMSKKLVSDGLINISTDWENYAEQVIDLFRSRKDYVKESFLRRDKNTKFEERGISLGHEIFNFTFRLMS